MHTAQLSPRYSSQDLDSLIPKDLPGRASFIRWGGVYEKGSLKWRLQRHLDECLAMHTYLASRPATELAARFNIMADAFSGDFTRFATLGALVAALCSPRGHGLNEPSALTVASIYRPDLVRAHFADWEE